MVLREENQCSFEISEACSPKIKGKTTLILFDNLKPRDSWQLLNLGTYSCTCMPGYFSTEVNEHRASKCDDVNECESDGINLCPPDAYCSDLNGEFEVRTDISM